MCNWLEKIVDAEHIMVALEDLAWGREIHLGFKFEGRAS
jgi:hypothetical protein